MMSARSRTSIFGTRRLPASVLATAACALLSIGPCLPAIAAGSDLKTDAPAPQPAVGAASLLPGGASALSETYGGWTVNCQVASNVKNCSMSLQQVNKKTNQRLFAMEVLARSTNEAVATLVLPFGVAVSKGVTLAVDDQKASSPFPFSTCLSGGCLVPLGLDHKLIQQMTDGKTLKVVGTIFDTQQPITFNIPLASFDAALARTAALSK
jgi:invasion protein IalB